METEDKVLFTIIAIVIGLVIAWAWAWSSVNNEVNRARDTDELRVACRNLPIQSAPVRCLELGNDK